MSWISIIQILLKLDKNFEENSPVAVDVTSAEAHRNTFLIKIRMDDHRRMEILLIQFHGKYMSMANFHFVVRHLQH